MTPVRAVPPLKPGRASASSFAPGPATSPQRPGILRKVEAPPPLPPVYAEPDAAPPMEAPVRSLGALPPPPARPRATPTPAPPTRTPAPQRLELLPPPAPRRGADEEELEIDPDRDDLALELIALAEEMKPARVPRRIPRLSPDAATRLLGEARRAEEDGDHDRAFRLYDEAAHAPSHAGLARLEYGRLERALGRRQRAISSFKEALHHTTEDRALTARLYAELGQLYWAMGEDEEADYYHRRASALDPSLARLHARTARTSDVHELDTRELDLALIG